MELQALKFTHKNNNFFLGLIPAEIVSQISYVARRGIDDEKGAVQRILNKARISGIRDFLLNNGFFPNNVILNFKSESNLAFSDVDNLLSFSVISRNAQIIDGQHRIEGLKEAIKLNPEIGQMLIPTVISNNLDTATCAEIFISINTEQKSVPKSLIYDLYGLMDISDKDFNIERGADIAKILNTEDSSPYQGYIKFPGSRKFKGGIQLSSFVNSLKPLVKTDGEFAKYAITTLDYQATVIKNFFNVLQSYYGDDWDSLNNPFLFASGFSAAIEVFMSRVLPSCFASRKFSEVYMKEIIVIPADKKIMQTEVKGLGGEAAREKIKNRIQEFVQAPVATEDDFEI